MLTATTIFFSLLIGYLYYFFEVFIHVNSTAWSCPPHLLPSTPPRHSQNVPLFCVGFAQVTTVAVIPRGPQPWHVQKTELYSITLPSPGSYIPSVSSSTAFPEGSGTVLKSSHLGPSTQGSLILSPITHSQHYYGYLCYLHWLSATSERSFPTQGWVQN